MACAQLRFGLEHLLQAAFALVVEGPDHQEAADIAERLDVLGRRLLDRHAALAQTPPTRPRRRGLRRSASCSRRHRAALPRCVPHRLDPRGPRCNRRARKPRGLRRGRVFRARATARDETRRAVAPASDPVLVMSRVERAPRSKTASLTGPSWGLSNRASCGSRAYGLGGPSARPLTRGQGWGSGLGRQGRQRGEKGETRRGTCGRLAGETGR